jgi:hypothetical protein
VYVKRENNQSNCHTVVFYIELPGATNLLAQPLKQKESGSWYCGLFHWFASDAVPKIDDGRIIFVEACFHSKKGMGSKTPIVTLCSVSVTFPTCNFLFLQGLLLCLPTFPFHCTLKIFLQSLCSPVAKREPLGFSYNYCRIKVTFGIHQKN